MISKLEFLLIKERPYIEFGQAPFGSNFDMWIKTLISKNEPNGVGPKGHKVDIKVRAKWRSIRVIGNMVSALAPATLFVCFYQMWSFFDRFFSRYMTLT